jgi:membrane protease YdiL (CAAX protease family)
LAAGIAPWPVLASLNLKAGATFPWSVPVQLAYMGLLWWFLSGGGRSVPGASTRRRNLRMNPVRGPRLIWSMTAGALLASAIVALALSGWMLVRVPATVLDQFTALGTHGLWIAVPMLLTGSFVAGAIEEAAFRGFMQVPLEERYGSRAAIGAVALLFTLAHFPAPIAWPGFILAAVGWGTLARLSDSILPGVVFHTAADAFVWIWAVLAPTSLERILTSSVSDGGATTAFAISASATTVLAIAATWALHQLAKVGRP